MQRFVNAGDNPIQSQPSFPSVFKGESMGKVALKKSNLFWNSAAGFLTRKAVMQMNRLLLR